MLLRVATSFSSLVWCCFGQRQHPRGNFQNAKCCFESCVRLPPFAGPCDCVPLGEKSKVYLGQDFLDSCPWIVMFTLGMTTDHGLGKTSIALPQTPVWVIFCFETCKTVVILPSPWKIGNWRFVHVFLCFNFICGFYCLKCKLLRGNLSGKAVYKEHKRNKTSKFPVDLGNFCDTQIICLPPNIRQWSVL